MKTLILLLALLCPQIVWGALALDGTTGKGHVTSGSTVTTNSVNLTTSTAGVVYAVIQVNQSTVASVSGATLTWSYRTSDISGTDNIYIYTAYSSGAISAQTITATMADSNLSYSDIVVFGVSGTPSSSYFDTNVSLPASSNGEPLNISTTASNTFIVSGLRCSSGPGETPGSGWTALYQINFMLVQYQIASSPQSSLSSASNGSCSANGNVADAVVQAGTGSFHPHHPVIQ